MIRKMAEVLCEVFALPLIRFPHVEAMATNIVDKQSQRGEEINSREKDHLSFIGAALATAIHLEVYCGSDDD